LDPSAWLEKGEGGIKVPSVPIPGHNQVGGVGGGGDLLSYLSSRGSKGSNNRPEIMSKIVFRIRSDLVHFVKK
jgi:hypothetical protein